MLTRRKIIIIDDDPSHLRIYGWILERGGYTALPVLVQRSGFDLPEGGADLVVLDYALGARLRATDIAQQIKLMLPNVPIVILSNFVGMPQDISKLATAFVEKGDPDTLLRTVSDVLEKAVT